MVLNLLLTIFDVAINGLAFGITSPFSPSGNGTALDKLRTGGIADPPPATFSIWGVIFIWQFAFLFAQFGCCCDVSKADVMNVTWAMIGAQLAQGCYGLLVFFVPDQLTVLWLAAFAITAAFAAFFFVTWKLRDYPIGTFFWLTFGYPINCAWLLIASYVQWSQLFVFIDLPMNVLQIPFLLLTVALIFFLSLYPVFRYPPAYFCVAFWTFTFQAALWTPEEGADAHFTEGIQTAYRIIVAVLAAVSLAGSVYVFWKKAAEKPEFSLLNPQLK